MIMCSHLSTFCGDEKKVEIGQHRHLLIALGLLIVIVNVAILFIVIPGVSYRLASFYSQDLHSDGYNQLAANLAEGNGYRFYPDTARTLMREPGYPIFLAGLLLVFGRSFAVVKLANMCLALTAAWLMTPIARKLSPNRALTVLPSLLFLFHPDFVSGDRQRPMVGLRDKRSGVRPRSVGEKYAPTVSNLSARLFHECWAAVDAEVRDLQEHGCDGSRYIHRYLSVGYSKLLTHETVRANS